MRDDTNLSLDWFDYVAFFSIVVIWIFIGLISSQLILLQLSVNPITWFLISAGIVFSFPIPIMLLSWKLKDNLGHIKPKWNFAERDVSIGEFQKMMKEYISSYPLLISVFIRFRFAIVILFVNASLIAPYSLSQLSLDLLFYSPAVFGGSLLLLGISLIATILPAISGPLSNEFPVYETRSIQRAYSFLRQVPILYWLGVNLTIGEWEGYYTIRNPILSARVEGIESICVIQFNLDNKGTLSEMTFKNKSEHGDFPLSEGISEPSLEVIRESLKTLILWYMNISDDTEILQEVLDDLQN